MKSSYIAPFLDAASLVIQQLVGVKPLPGKFFLKEIVGVDKYVWIHIGITGEIEGNIYYGIPEEVALKMVSVMMGGYVITELNELGHSAISELGNMVSGNFSTLLYQQGIHVDITPPKLLTPTEQVQFESQKLLVLPLHIDGIGSIDVQVLITP